VDDTSQITAGIGLVLVAPWAPLIRIFRRFMGVGSLRISL
jgi:hypothetical protein